MWIYTMIRPYFYSIYSKRIKGRLYNIYFLFRIFYYWRVYVVRLWCNIWSARKIIEMLMFRKISFFAIQLSQQSIWPRLEKCFLWLKKVTVKSLTVEKNRYNDFYVTIMCGYNFENILRKIILYVEWECFYHKK